MVAHRPGRLFGLVISSLFFLLAAAAIASAQPGAGAPGGTSTSSASPTAPLDPLEAGQRALRDGRPDEAIRQLTRAVEAYGDSEEGASARYLLAQAIDGQGDRPAEALAAYQAFLTRDRGRAPARLIAVAEARSARLNAERDDWPAWSRLEVLERQLRGRSYAERVTEIERFIASAPPSVVAAARAALVQDGWEQGDWHGALRQLELLGADRPGATAALKQQLRQVRKEIRRDRLAILAVAVFLLCLVGGVAVRPWRELGPRDIRWLMVLAANWTVLSALLYGVYEVGRRSTDVSPVTPGRFAVLWGTVTLALAAGSAWNLVFRRRFAAVGRSLVALAVGALLCGSALYLYCYAYDYVSIFGL